MKDIFLHKNSQVEHKTHNGIMMTSLKSHFGKNLYIDITTIYFYSIIVIEFFENYT